MTIHGHICSPPLYEYTRNGHTYQFEHGPSTYPWPLKKDGSPRKVAGRDFWKAVDAWFAEPDRERFRIGGGCETF